MDITGIRFGRLIALNRVPNLFKGKTQWNCRCDCGKEKTIVLGSLRRGLTTSCGCYRRECVRTVGASNLKHGARSKTDAFEGVKYTVWAMMLHRCRNLQDRDYGGRGIEVCDEWLRFETFSAWALQTGYREGLEIDRIDNSGDYTPANCRWVTRKENSRNRRSCRYYTFLGETLCLSAWAERYGHKPSTLNERIRRGWELKSALETPCNIVHRRKAG